MQRVTENARLEGALLPHQNYCRRHCIPFTCPLLPHCYSAAIDIGAQLLKLTIKMASAEAKDEAARAAMQQVGAWVMGGGQGSSALEALAWLGGGWGVQMTR